jgi:hypothetical protein
MRSLLTAVLVALTGATVSAAQSPDSARTPPPAQAASPVRTSGAYMNIGFVG